MKQKSRKPASNKSVSEQSLILKALDDIIDHSESFLIVCRIEPETWHVEYVSDNVEQFLGYSVDDFVSGRILLVNIVHPDDLQRLEIEAAQYLKSKTRHWSQKYRLITKSGAVKWFRNDNVATTDEGGEISNIKSIVHDITRYQEMENALRESEIRYSYLVENASDSVNIIQDKVIKFANKRMAEISGYTVEELTGMSTFDLVPPDFTPVLTERFAKREQGQAVSNIFYTQMLCKDGTIKEIENSVNLIQYEGKPAVLGIARDVTEHKLMEEQLLREKKYFHALVEHSSDIIVAVDRDGVVIYENPTLEQILGYKRDERSGQGLHNVFEFVHPDDLHIIIDKFNTLRDNPSAPLQQADVRVRDTNGEWHIFDVMGSNLIQDDVISSIIINMRDITERKRTQEELQNYRDHLAELVAERTKELKESEEKFHIIFNSITDGISVIDLSTGKIIDTNPAALNMFNFTRDDVIGSYSYELIAESDRQRAMEDIVHTIATGDSGVAEWRLLGKGGTEHDCEAHAGVIYDSSGNPLYLVNVMRDIGERRRINEAIRESERRYRILAENVSDVILTLNMNLRFTYISPSGLRLQALKALCKLSIEELPAWSIQDILTPESLQKAIQVLEEELALESAEGADPYRSRHLIVQTKDATHTWLDVKASFIRDHKGHATGILCVVRDITNSKKEEELRAELERKAQINNRLASIGGMAAGIAHEINNPLSPIVGFVDLLLKEDLTDAVKADLCTIRDCANQAADITKRLLIFARQVKPVRMLCNINEIVSNTIKIMDYHLKTNNITVALDLDHKLPITTADKAQMQQVLINLIMNAEYEMKKYHGGGSLTIRTESTYDLIRILVRDDGPGILEKHMDKIFEPFFSTKKGEEGTGLGLSICHGIVTEHNGKIYAESEAGKGATFIIELPIIKQLATE